MEQGGAGYAAVQRWKLGDASGVDQSAGQRAGGRVITQARRQSRAVEIEAQTVDPDRWPLRRWQTQLIKGEARPGDNYVAQKGGAQVGQRRRRAGVEEGAACTSEQAPPGQRPAHRRQNARLKSAAME